MWKIAVYYFENIYIVQISKENQIILLKSGMEN